MKQTASIAQAVTSRLGQKRPCRISCFRSAPAFPSCILLHFGGSLISTAVQTQDKAQYFPQDPTAQPFPPYSTDPKVTASVQVPLKVEVERRKRLFSNQDIM
jgi:hypothetical protein